MAEALAAALSDIAAAARAAGADSLLVAAGPLPPHNPLTGTRPAPFLDVDAHCSTNTTARASWIPLRTRMIVSCAAFGMIGPFVLDEEPGAAGMIAESEHDTTASHHGVPPSPFVVAARRRLHQAKSHFAAFLSEPGRWMRRRKDRRARADVLLETAAGSSIRRIRTLWRHEGAAARVFFIVKLTPGGEASAHERIDASLVLGPDYAEAVLRAQP